MTSKIKTIHLLLLEPSSNHAEDIINALRNRGFAVRATQVLTAEELTHALEHGVADLLIANLDHSDLTPKDALEQIAGFGRDIPCIVLMAKYDDEVLTEAMQYGAKDGVTKSNLPLMCLKVERELQSLDVRRRKTQTDLALKATEKRCTLLLDNSQDAIAYVHDGMHVYANQAYMQLFGYDDPDELMCIPALDMITKDSQDEFRQYLKNMSETSDQQSFSFGGVKSDMSQFDAIMTLSTANYDEEMCTQLLIRPAADNVELEEKLRELSAQDSLTELFNKTYFNEQLQKAVEKASESGDTYYVLYIEYDQYSSMLNEFGIAGVDKLTQECAKWLAEQVDDSYNLARTGDHSFCLLVPDNTGKLAKSVANSLCEKIRPHLFDVEGHTFKLTFSIGICPVGDGAKDAPQIISDAHNASNRVDNGDGVRVFNSAIQKANAGEDGEMLDKVHDAIESGRIKLAYQPIVKLHGDEKSLYQVLLRLTDEDGNSLDSSKVFPVAKAAGLATKLDIWVFKKALKALKTETTAANSQLFVSLSAPTLITDKIASVLDKTFKSSGVDKERVIFQIDENDAVNHLKRVIALAAELKQKGYLICLSNFGNDPSQKVLVDQLDADFVRICDAKAELIAKEPEVAEEVQELLDEIHNQNKQSIIPKVEEASTLAALWPMNVRYIQGYYLQRPGEKMDYDFSSSGF